MWLLNTATAELEWFSDAAAVTGGYAILSHTWGKHEQTFQDVYAIGERCKKSGKNPRDFVSHKIRECCRLAERYGYGWVWIDSCCIDKTSSTELSEAINSMFKWYWQAEVCFAFLADVPTGSEADLRAERSKFRESRWHRRGWTLQELIAPAVVIFVSGDWERLGTKAELAELIEEITHIPQLILTRKQYYHQTSVANRMRWAAGRRTTRAEDQAYCLMGLFDVSMPIIYGEGTRAFQRLQQKIMKHGFDMSLFAWGSWFSSKPLREQKLKPDLTREIDRYNDQSYLLAPSPASFEAGFDFTPLHPNADQTYPPLALTEEDKRRGPPFGDIRIPTATLKNYGVACEFPVFESDGFVVAVLLCEDEKHEQVGLLLAQDYDSYDPHQPLYYTSAVFMEANDARPCSGNDGRGSERGGERCSERDGESDMEGKREGDREINETTGNDGEYNDVETTDKAPVSYRLVTLGCDLYNLQFNGKPVEARWRTLFIQPRPEAWYSPDTSIARLQLNCTMRPPFRIPHWLIAKFASLGFQMAQMTPEGEFPTRLGLSSALDGEYINLDLGLCDRHGSQLEPNAHRWARVLIHHAEDISDWCDPHAPHDCAEDHIASWPERRKLFGDNGVRGIQLSFEDCNIATTHMNPRTLAARIELKGSVYADIERRAKERRDPKHPKHLGPHLMPDTVLSEESASQTHARPDLIFFFMVGAIFSMVVSRVTLVLVLAMCLVVRSRAIGVVSVSASPAPSRSSLPVIQ